jgi:hypothetical protein
VKYGAGLAELNELARRWLGDPVPEPRACPQPGQWARRLSAITMAPETAWHLVVGWDAGEGRLDVACGAGRVFSRAFGSGEVPGVAQARDTEPAGACRSCRRKRLRGWRRARSAV